MLSSLAKQTIRGMQAIGMKGETSQETEGKDKRNIHEKKEAINDVEKIVAKHE
jgi:hypothetical protein